MWQQHKEVFNSVCKDQDEWHLNYIFKHKQEFSKWPGRARGEATAVGVARAKLCRWENPHVAEMANRAVDLVPSEPQMEGHLQSIGTDNPTVVLTYVPT